MSITRRVITTTTEPDERRYPPPEQLICPVCGEPARPEQPAYWRVADGPVPGWSHPNREPLCPSSPTTGPVPHNPPTSAAHGPTSR